MEHNKVTYLKDYQQPTFFIPHIKLYFNIKSLEKVEVTAKLTVTKNPNVNHNQLILNGVNLHTVYLKINDETLAEGKDYEIKDEHLIIFNPQHEFTLETQVIINPAANTSLMGIYKTQNNLCSQCEPEGFRKITWFIDRPDNMGKWDVEIEADKKMFPILLSNGNEVSKKELPSNRVVKSFSDPFNKPCYLFAFVAGDFDCLKDHYITTISNKKVDLRIYVEKGKKDQAVYAMESLKRAMLWDEQTFNLEYDLEIFSIVTSQDFNFGAMENKSLNIFNEEYVLARPELVTDKDFYRIEAVVAHEYFHNWTGDRVTCRDWFQLTLKEGLTVFRDHKFSESLHFKDCARIEEVEVLKKVQFNEDNSGLSHPIRPAQYIEIDNFYTSTVYEKGSEVIRMIYTILGEENFKKGMAVYFKNFDGKAVTCDDFVWSMEQASGVDLTQFKKWYSEAGTPIVNVTTNYNPKAQTYTINLEQNNTFTNGKPLITNLVIPLTTALFDKSTGNKVNLITENNSLGKETLIILDNKSKTITFENIKEEPVLSINRFFSAPVIVNYKHSTDDLITLIKHDTDGVNRYEATRNYLSKYCLKIITALENNTAYNLNPEVFSPFAEIFKTYNNPYLQSMLIKELDFTTVTNHYKENIPLKSIITALKELKLNFATSLEQVLISHFNILKADDNSIEKSEYAKRALKNTLLNYLVNLNKKEYFDLAVNYYNSTVNMTNRLGVLAALKNFAGHEERENIFKRFYTEYKQEPIVINKYLMLEAASESPDIINKLQELTNNKEVFSWYNPNKVRSLFGAFAANNHMAFHAETGKGYKFLAEAIIKLDDINSAVAAKLTAGFSNKKKLPKINQELINTELNMILQKPKLSKGVFEISSKILKG